MNERGHVVNAVLLSLGLGVIRTGELSMATFETIVLVTPPIVLGALFPDIDTSFGTHRKTFHNVWVLALAVTFPVYAGNLEYVWVGIATHYVLDLLGNVKGMALLYPRDSFSDAPVGVNGRQQVGGRRHARRHGVRTGGARAGRRPRPRGDDRRA